MKRPGFQKMIQAIENGYISAVLVKVLSRLGRNYIEVGRLTEFFLSKRNAECPPRILKSCKNTPHGPGEQKMPHFFLDDLQLDFLFGLLQLIQSPLGRNIDDR